MAKQYISFGLKEIKPEIFENIGTGSNLKPIGGLFAYDYAPNNNSNSPYEEWCEKEGLDRGSLREGIIFTIAPDARLYVVNSWADMHVLIKKFPVIRTVEGVSGKKITGIDIDFASMAQKYDGIKFTYKGTANTTLREEHEIDVLAEGIIKGKDKREYEIDGNIKLDTSNWEMPCIVIFNPRIIKEIETFDNPIIHPLDYNEMYDEILKEIKNGKKQEEIDIELQYLGQDNVIVSAIYDIVVDAEKKEKKHTDLLERLEGLISVQLTGNINLQDDIDLTVQKIYDISLKNESFEKFSKYVCASLRSGILGIGYNQGEIEDEMDIISNAFGNFFDD